MNTLLLTLLVVTIVCLDFGYTTKCLTKFSPGLQTSQTCPAGQKICFKKWKKGKKVSRGCAVTCPKPKKHETIQCCTENNCNR
uniref:Three-finger toxin 4a n=1 Tax=Micrurus fulvius TaxID=8637 RepID=U3FVH8_MICFL